MVEFGDTHAVITHRLQPRHLLGDTSQVGINTHVNFHVMSSSLLPVKNCPHTQAPIEGDYAKEA
ncbi:MAG: hypothetical protein ACJATP_003131 [Candidatus Azotimanducaceae bacterium]|jgi:hypothetical protein